MEAKTRTPSKLTQFPPELVELIFYHIKHYRSYRYYTGPVNLFDERRSLCVFSRVCKQWANIAQTMLWQSVDLRSDKVTQRVLSSPVFGQHSIVSLSLESIKFEDVARVLRGLRSLRELVWGVETDKEATWWNYENLADLRALSIKTWLVLPSQPQPRFHLKELSIHLQGIDLLVEENTLSSILASFASTIETVEFRGCKLPSWFDRFQLPSLRILGITPGFWDRYFSTEDLHGVTHLRLRHYEILSLDTITNLKFPSTLQSLEIACKTGFLGDHSPKNFQWAHFFQIPFEEYVSLTSPSLRSIYVCVPRGMEEIPDTVKYPSGFITKHGGKDLDFIRPSDVEMWAIKETQAFWKRRGILFHVDWMDYS